MNVNKTNIEGNESQLDQPRSPTIHVRFSFIPDLESVTKELHPDSEIMPA